MKVGSSKDYFKEIPFKICRCQMMGEFLRPMPRMTWFSRPKNNKCSPKKRKFDLESQFFKGLGKSMTPYKRIFKSERKRS